MLLAVVGLNYDFKSEARVQMNTSVEDSLSQGMRGYWKLDDGSGSNATDSSGNANTLAMTGSPGWVTGNIGPYALDFSGSGQYLSVADPASGVLDNFSGVSRSYFTIAGWFNRDTSNTEDTIVAKANSTSGDGYDVWIDAATDKLNFQVNDSGDADATHSASVTTFTTTGWHHFAVLFAEALDFYPMIYIDGHLDCDGTSSCGDTGFIHYIDSVDTNLAFRIGAESDGGNPFDGKLDDIRVYGNALSAEEVKKLYNTTAPAQPVDTGLVGYWTFDGPDIQGTTVIDRSGKGNNGTLTGTTKTIGKLGQALSFNGSSDYVDAGDINATDGVSKLSVSVWIYDANPTALAPIVSKYSSIDGNWNFRTGGSNDYMIFAFDFSNYGYTYDYAHEASIWEHWVAVFDGTQTGNSNRLKIYKNGELNVAGFGGTIPATTFSDSNAVRIGSRPDGSYYWNGKIDDVRVYTRALSASEVLYLFNQGK